LCQGAYDRRADSSGRAGHQNYMTTQVNVHTALSAS
jgi:hypothetical protein